MVKAAKPVNATVEELDAVKTELKNLITALSKKKADKEEVQPPATRVQNNVDILTETVRKNAEVSEEAVNAARAETKAHTDKTYMDLRDEVLPMIAKEQEERDTADKQMEAVIETLNDELRSAFADELTSLCGKIEEEFATIREELTELIELRAQEAAEALEQSRNEIADALEDLRDEAAARDEETRHIASEDLRWSMEAEMEVDAQDQAQARKDRQELDAMIARLDAELDAARKFAKGDTDAARQEAIDALDDFKADTKDKFSQTRARGDQHQDFLHMLDQVQCRRVEWCLKDAAALLQSAIAPTPSGGRGPGDEGASPKYVSFFSSKFHAAGNFGFQMELRLPAKSSQEGGSPSSRGGGGGSDKDKECGLFLWCPKGLQLNLRFFAGDKWVTVDKGSHTEGPIGVKRMGYLEDHIDTESNTVRVGVEILEAIKDFSEQAKVSPTLTMGVDGGEEPVPSPSDRQVRGVLPFEGTLSFHRHINHRVLPQVRKEVERMQNKFVRRVEWKIGEANQLDRIFPHGTPICSPLFNAAGVEGMQFIFYPMGYLDSTEGFCSIFLYCPAGTTFKCSIVAGSQKRDISNQWKEAGAFGRVNFCRLDNVVDADTNSALLCLEIDEVTMEVQKSANHTANDNRTKSKRQVLELESAAPVPAVGSSIKLVRVTDRLGLTEVNRIPNLWTMQALGDFVKKPDGYSEFKELTEIGKPAKPARPRSVLAQLPEGAATTAPPGRGFGLTTAKSESVLLTKSLGPLPEHFTSGAIPDGHSLPPLICGAQGEFGVDQGYGSPMLWAGKPRKARTVGKR
eukprot:TRINITY_DN35265_c0_g1_i1.p1 TRINITY_DN35265_c0_g1~~TRINITY_DN35265_c0_g1_i1.p1  ORF type:complete len:802 (-),score=175.18 TRINITY_DN35265_c0_g1_i1:112-2517(-)